MTKDSACTQRTAFIHLHSLVSRDISMPCPHGIINAVQQLLIDVVAYYEFLFDSNKRHHSQEDCDILELYAHELNRRLRQITLAQGERLMEAMLWAWLHTLLQSEQMWKQQLHGEQWQFRARLQTGDHLLSSALRHRIACRLEDLSALRRVIVFTCVGGVVLRLDLSLTFVWMRPSGLRPFETLPLRRLPYTRANQSRQATSPHHTATVPCIEGRSTITTAASTTRTWGNDCKIPLPIRSSAA